MWVQDATCLGPGALERGGARARPHLITLGTQQLEGCLLGRVPLRAQPGTA